MQEKEKVAFEFARDTTKEFLALASGIIALTITFSKDFLSGSSEAVRIFALLSWASFLVSVFFGLWTLLALTGTLESKNPAIPVSIRGSNVVFPSCLQIVAFMAGLVLTVAFAVKAVNHPAEPPTPAKGEGITALMPWIVSFETNSSTLGPDSVRNLMTQARNLSKTRGRIIIEGHTDSSGASEYNVELARARIEEVRAILIESGVKASRIKTVPFGESHPASSNQTAEGRLMNRRVIISLEAEDTAPNQGPQADG